MMVRHCDDKKGMEKLNVGDYICIQGNPYKVIKKLSTGLSIEDNNKRIEIDLFKDACKCYYGTYVIALKYLKQDILCKCNKDECPEYHV